MLKKKKIKKIIALSSISVGLLGMGITEAQLSQNTIQAATKKITLKKNAYIYNNKGKRVGKKKLYKNHTYKYYNKKKIHGKKYYRVGKNKYIKAANVASKKSQNITKANSYKLNISGLGSPKFQVKLINNNVDVYDSSDTRPSHWLFNVNMKGQTVNVYAEENGAYEIGNGQWIQSENKNVVDSSVPIFKNSTNSDKQKKTKNKKNSSTSNKSNDPDVIASDGHLTEYQQNKIAQLFVDMINRDRESKGISSLKLDSNITNLARQRAIHDAKTIATTGEEDSHKDSNGKRAIPWSMGEVETTLHLKGSRTTSLLAKRAYNSFMLYDGDVNWAHRDNLLNSNYTKIGVGIYFTNGENTPGSLIADLQ